MQGGCNGKELENKVIKLAQSKSLQVHAGYREETYRLIVHYGNRFKGKDTPKAKTLYPDGSKEPFEMKHGEERALFAYVYKQDISRDKVTPDCRELLCRGNESSYALVQVWPGKVNETFWEKFDPVVQWKAGDPPESIEDELREHPSVELQAVRDLMEVVKKLFKKLFGESVEDLPLMVVRTKQEELNSDLVFEGEACQIREFLEECTDEMLKFLNICSVTEGGFESVKMEHGQSMGNKPIILKSTLEETVCYMREARPERFRNVISSLEFHRGRSCLQTTGTEEVVRSWRLPLADWQVQQERLPDGESGGEPGSSPEVLQGLDLLKEIGKGGCAVVMLARDRKGRNYAVKLQHLKNLDPKSREVLSREVKTIKHLRSKLRSYEDEKGHVFPFLIPMVAEFILAEPLTNKKSLLGNCVVADIHHCTTFDMVLVMDYAEGGSLYGEIERHKAATGKHPREQRLGELRLYLAEIVAAVGFLHGADVVHRDLSLKNILLRGGHVKVADFGLSKRVDCTAVQTNVGAVIKAPELLLSQPYDEKCDVFSYGAIFKDVLDLKAAVPEDDFEKEAAGLHEQCVKADPKQRPSFEQLKGHGFFKAVPEQLKGHGFFKAVPIRTARSSKLPPFFVEIIEGGEINWNCLESEAAQAEPRLPSRRNTSWAHSSGEQASHESAGGSSPALAKASEAEPGASEQPVGQPSHCELQ